MTIIINDDMNYLQIINADVYDFICEYLNNKDLYNLANTYQIRGIYNIKNLMNYCEDNEDIEEIGCGSSDEVARIYKKMINFNDLNNIKILSKNFKLKYFSNEIKSDKELVMEFIKFNAYNIRYAHVKFLDDKDIIMEVAKEYGQIVENISERLTDDEEIVNTAIKNNKIAILYASERIQSKYNEILEDVKDCCRSRELSHRILLRDGWYLNEELTDDKYVKMRKLHNDAIKYLDNYYELKRSQEKSQEELLQKLDHDYRIKNKLPKNTIIYRDIYNREISQQEYLDDYYENCGH